MKLIGTFDYISVCDICGNHGDYCWCILPSRDVPDIRRCISIPRAVRRIPILNIVIFCKQCKNIKLNNSNFNFTEIENLNQKFKFFKQSNIQLLYDNKEQLEKLNDEEFRLFIILYTNFDLMVPQINKIRKWYELIEPSI